MLTTKLQFVMSSFAIFVLFKGSSVFALGINKFGETFQSSFSIIIDSFVVSLGEAFDGGET